MMAVVPYDSLWAKSFTAEAEELRALLGDSLIAIHHVGSTAVSGMSAKPIVDVLVVVRDLHAVDGLNEEFRRRGYLPRGENGIPGRCYLIKGTREIRSHHIHIFTPGHPEIERLLAVRDYLRQHLSEQAAYSAFKDDLARRFPTDRDRYVQGKELYMLSLIGRALEWRATQAGIIPKDDR